ncbi:MAG: hypothetical protein DI535_09240 [Citrobacter freundii]|nr:MAG: hypothetical protein DI535_09240 [Citrobacter freundii]
MGTKAFFKEKLWPFLAGLGSAGIMVLAFFIPSLQDQWDRYQSRKIIDQYEMLGNDFYTEERYDLAEQAYQKAFELSESRRLDLDVKRLQAKVNRINIDPKWGGTMPEDLEEIDFQYLLHLLKGKEQEQERVSTLNSYGIFLAGSHKMAQAEQSFKEAVRTDSSDVLAYINLGNLYDQEKKKDLALQYYQKAIGIDSLNARARYNLGLLYMEKEQWLLARQQMEKVIQADSSDNDAKAQYQIIQHEIQVSGH